MRRGAGALPRPQDLVLRLALGLSLVGGFGLGLYLLLGFALRLPLPSSAPVLIQAHGVVQAFGLVPLFVLAVGSQLFPKFHDADLDHPEQVSLGGLLVAAGVILRAVAQPAEPAAWRSIALVGGALMTLAGILLALEALGRVARRGRIKGRGRLMLTATTGASLVGAALLNVAIAVSLAGGQTIVPTGLDEAFLHLALWGFGAGMVLAVSGRVFDTLLLLQPERDRFVRPMQMAWLVGTAGVPLAWFLVPGWPLARAIAYSAQFLGALGFVLSLRLYETPRSASRLSVTESTRRWARIAFGFLLLSAAAAAALALSETLGWVVPDSTAISAARHALAQGFLLPFMVFMGARTLPGYSASTLRHPRLLGAILASLFVGAGLRVFAELFGGYAAGWGIAVGAGGTLGVLGFTAFAIGAWSSAGPARRPSGAHPATRGTVQPSLS